MSYATHQRLTTPRATAHWLWLALLAVCPLLPLGCGGGSASLTGGSIPTGATTRAGDVSGTVVSAADPDTPLDGVEVRAVLPDGSTRTSRTDADGAFTIADIAEGEIHLEVLPPPRYGVHPRDLRLNVARNEETAVAVLLEPLTGPAVPQFAGTLAITPQAVTVRVDEFVDFRINLRQGSPPEPRPVWIVEGNIGHVSPRGRFVARRPGSGRVIALLGEQRAVAEVTVLEARGQQ